MKAILLVTEVPEGFSSVFSKIGNELVDLISAKIKIAYESQGSPRMKIKLETSVVFSSDKLRDILANSRTDDALKELNLDLPDIMILPNNVDK